MRHSPTQGYDFLFKNRNWFQVPDANMLHVLEVSYRLLPMVNNGWTDLACFVLG
jgi:hypothetical protein